MPVRLALRRLNAIKTISKTAIKRIPKQIKLVADTIKLDTLVANKFTQNSPKIGIINVKPIKYLNFITAYFFKHKS
ncbi:hypothetical protein GCM10009193_08480 [Shewanella aestuarii]|nr:hypothetical protein GCM10009193_08480 [Shewanella aestuarii]